MNIRCPNCGAVHSLDTLINDADASAVLKAVLDMDAEFGKAAIRYIGLFRPAKSQLSWSRTAKLLNELMPSIKAATVERDGVSYPAPAAAWIHGFWPLPPCWPSSARITQDTAAPPSKARRKRRALSASGTSRPPPRRKPISPE